MEKEGKKILIMCLMGSHGFIVNNEQAIVCNELADNNCFELLPAERLLKTIAAKHANVYFITLWNCCRDKFDPIKFLKNHRRDDEISPDEI